MRDLDGGHRVRDVVRRWRTTGPNRPASRCQKPGRGC